MTPPQPGRPSVRCELQPRAGRPGRRAGRWEDAAPAAGGSTEGPGTRGQGPLPFPGHDNIAGRRRGAADERPQARDDRPPRRAGTGPDDRGPGGADLPDDLVRVRRHPARCRPVRAEGAGEHLHADHESDPGRVRAAGDAARRRDRRRRNGVRPVGGGVLRPQPGPGRRQHHLGLDPLRRHLQPVRTHAAAVRDRGALGRPGRPRGGRSARRTRTRSSCSQRRSATPS